MFLACGGSILLCQCFAQFQLKNFDRKLANAAMAEGSRTRVEQGQQGRVLRHGFVSSVRITLDAKGALRPAQNAIRLARPLPQEEINLFATTKDGNAIDMRMQVAGGAADSAHSDDSGEQPFIALKDFKARFSPKFAALPVKLRTKAAQPGDRGRLLHQFLKAQTRQRSAVGEGRGQT